MFIIEREKKLILEVPFHKHTLDAINAKLSSRKMKKA
jgi:hypothetical protein